MTVDGFIIKSDGLYLSSGKFVANCVPIVRSKTALLDSTQTDESGKPTVICYLITIEFKCFYHDINSGDSTIIKDIKIDRLDKIDLVTIHPNLYAESRKDVINYIKAQIPKAPMFEKYLIKRYGWISINGSHMFAMGNNMIGNTSNLDFEFSQEQLDFKFSYDKNISDAEASERFWNLLSVCAKQKQGLGFIILYLMGAYIRQPIKDAGYNPNTVMWLHGRSQSGKTTFTKGIGCHILNKDMRAGNYTRVASTVAAVEKSIGIFKDLPYIYDDLYYDDRKTMRQIEEKVKLLIRSQADGVIREKLGSDSYENNAQLFIIGEYLIDGISNIGRLIYIELKEPINSTILNMVKKYEEYIKAFIFFYIKWIADHYSDIVNFIRETIINIRKSFSGQTSRNYDKMMYTGIITEVFFQYFIDNSGFNNDVTNNFKSIILHGWDVLLGANYTFFEKKRGEEQLKIDPNYSRLLCKAIEHKMITPMAKGSDFFSKSCRKQECYYIRCDFFRQLIFKISGVQVSAKALTEYFRLRNIGIFGSEVLQYKKNNKRYLVLKLSELRSDAFE